MYVCMRLHVACPTSSCSHAVEARRSGEAKPPRAAGGSAGLPMVSQISTNNTNITKNHTSMGKRFPLICTSSNQCSNVSQVCGSAQSYDSLNMLYGP